jgi:hypothetical protein
MQVTINFDTGHQADRELLASIQGLLNGTHIAIEKPYITPRAATEPKSRSNTVIGRFIEKLIAWPGDEISLKDVGRMGWEVDGSPSTLESYIYKMAMPVSRGGATCVIARGCGVYELPPRELRESSLRDWKLPPY